MGGCVRDRLLGRPVHDYDLTVSCLPDRTAWLFRDHRLVEDGRKHGTIGVVTEGGVLEMTTFRTDGEYRDHRHPESVRFVPDLREDLARRDFTVNAMALSCRGELRDPFGGQADPCRPSAALCGRPLPAVPGGRPAHSAVCPVRSELGFRVEEATFRAGKELAGEAAAVSRSGSLPNGKNTSPDITLPGRWNCCPCGRASSPAWGASRRAGKAALCRGTFPGEPALLLAGGLREVRYGSAPGWGGGLGRSRPGTVRPTAAVRKPGAPLEGGGGLSGTAPGGVVPGGVAAVGR